MTRTSYTERLAYRSVQRFVGQRGWTVWKHLKSAGTRAGIKAVDGCKGRCNQNQIPRRRPQRDIANRLQSGVTTS